MKQPDKMPEFPGLKANIPRLIYNISLALHDQGSHNNIVQEDLSDLSGSSAVLFLLGLQKIKQGNSSEPCLILNKRSENVKQAGDLCCPGGGISIPLDSHISKLLYFPGSPLKRWPFWKSWRNLQSEKPRSLALVLATSLRESYEEMRLNPLRVKFLGSLPIQQLSMFGRKIYPMVGWVSNQARFSPNWEVEKIVSLPFRYLLNIDNYSRIRFSMETPRENRPDLYENDYPCIIHKQENESDILWGVTFRIVIVFLETVFGFKLPPLESLPLVQGALSSNYFTGNRSTAQAQRLQKRI